MTRIWFGIPKYQIQFNYIVSVADFPMLILKRACLSGVGLVGVPEHPVRSQYSSLLINLTEIYCLRYSNDVVSILDLKTSKRYTMTIAPNNILLTKWG